MSGRCEGSGSVVVPGHFVEGMHMRCAACQSWAPVAHDGDTFALREHEPPLWPSLEEADAYLAEAMRQTPDIVKRARAEMPPEMGIEEVWRHRRRVVESYHPTRWRELARHVRALVGDPQRGAG